MKRIIIWILVAGFVILLGSAGYTFNQIYRQVTRITEVAKSEFSGDAVKALCSLADPEALPFLEKLKPDTEDDTIPFDRSSSKFISVRL